jgi:hypothetical protein
MLKKNSQIISPDVSVALCQCFSETQEYSVFIVTFFGQIFVLLKYNKMD